MRPFTSAERDTGQLLQRGSRNRPKVLAAHLTAEEGAFDTLDVLAIDVLDKTGTLAEGRPKLVTLISVGAKDDESLLRLVASLEKASEHPLAGAIVTGAIERGVKLGSVTDFESVTGEGVIALRLRRVEL